MAVAVTMGIERTVEITYDGVECVFGKFDRGKVTVDRWTGRVDVIHRLKLLMEQAGSTL